MNKAQKGAWCNLITCVLLFTINTSVVIQGIVTGRDPSLRHSHWIMLIPAIMAITLFVLFRKKQSQVEVRLDERDRLIKRGALVVAYFAIWILLIATFIISWLVVGRKGSIPIFTLLLIFYFVFLISSMVYFAAILIQYGWGAKTNEFKKGQIL